MKKGAFSPWAADIQGQERECRSPCRCPPLAKFTIKKELAAPAGTRPWRPGGEPGVFQESRLLESAEKAETQHLGLTLSSERSQRDCSKAQETQHSLPKEEIMSATSGKALSQAE